MRSFFFAAAVFAALTFPRIVQAQTYTYGLEANRYLVHDGNLYGATIQGVTSASSSDFSQIDAGGWTGDIEFAGNYVYMMKDHTLYAQEMDGLQRIGPGVQTIASGTDWEGDLEIEGGQLYLMKNGNLYRAPITNGTSVGTLQLISSGGWSGDLEIDGGYVYMATNDNLYGAALSGLSTAPTTVVNSGGWSGDIEFQDGYVYIMKNDNLYGAPISGLTITGSFVTIGTGGWTGDLELNDTKLPIWDTNMTFVDSGTSTSSAPVITGSSMPYSGDPYTLAADPIVVVVGSTLVTVFEAQKDTGPSEIWMAHTTSSLTSWQGFTKVNYNAGLIGHPQAIVYNGQFVVFWSDDANAIHSRSAPVSSLFDQGGPQWGSETTIFSGNLACWRKLVEFAIFPRSGKWYLLGITTNGTCTTATCADTLTCNGTEADSWIRGRSSDVFPGNWTASNLETESSEMANPGAGTPVLAKPSPSPQWSGFTSAASYRMVELTYQNTDNTPLLMVGMRSDDIPGTPPAEVWGIASYEISSISTSSMTGQWLKSGYSLSPQPWTHNRIHCANVVRFNSQYVYVFDGVTDPSAANLHWAMGFATLPIFP